MSLWRSKSSERDGNCIGQNSSWTMPGRKYTCCSEQDGQCTCNIVARSRYHFTVETVPSPTVKNYTYRFLKEIIFLLIYTLLPVAYKRRIETKECSFALDLLQTYSRAKQIVMACKPLRCFQFLSVAVKHLTRLDGINRL
jgi:hypothetical protein